MPDRFEVIRNSFLNQAKWCDELESKFTAALLREIASDFDKKGVLFNLCGDWPTNPISDALGLRICGGLHNLALRNPNSELAKEWPPLKKNWDIRSAWSEAESAIQDNFAWFKDFILLPPQTNEVRRSAAIFSGVCAASFGFAGPIDVLELGASAGLNQSFDEFEYSLCGFHSLAKSNVKIETDWRGNPCRQLRNIKIRSRAACDQSPIDVLAAQNNLLLKSYIWPDQAERLIRTEAAIQIAIKNKIVVEKSDASVWLKNALKQRANDAMTIVFHSVFFNYPPEEIRRQIFETMHGEIKSSIAAAPLVWLRFENFGSLFENKNSNEFTNSFVLDMVAMDYENGLISHKTLAKIDPHCRWIEWL